MTVFSSLARYLRVSSIFFCVSLAYADGVPSADSTRLELSWHLGAKGVVGLERLAAFLGGSASIAKVSFSGDVLLDDDELRYTTNCSQGAVIEAAGIARAFAALVCSQRFTHIRLIFEKKYEGIVLQWLFEGRWRFDRLKVHGLLVGKDWYAQMYQADPGMTFDAALHEKRLQSMVTTLHDSGYFDAHVAARLDKNVTRKLYESHVWPHKGKHYMFGAMQSLVEPYEEVSEGALSDVRSFANLFLKKKLAGGRYSRVYLNAVASDLKQELTLKGFLQARISLREVIRRSTKSVDVTITIKVGQCKRIVFFGNTFFPTKQLFDRLLLFGQSVLLLPGSVLADEIISLYKDKGFFDAKVEVVEEREALFFVVTEGKRLAVIPFEPTGVSECNKQRIMALVTPFIASQWFDTTMMAHMIDSLRDWYARNGYLSCHIAVSEPEPSKDGVRVLVSVSEGECLTVHSTRLIFDGGGLPSVVFEKRLQQDTGKPLSPQLIDDQRSYLQNGLRDQGYTQAHLSFERKGGDLEWRVSGAGAKTYVGQIILGGTTKTPFKHLEQLIKKQQGVIWRQEVFKNLFNECKQTDVFSAIHLDPVGSNKMTDRPLCLTLHDEDPFELRLRAGAALEHVTKHISISGITYRAGGTLLVKNLCNRADTARIEADISATQRTLELGYTQPWFLGSPVRYEGLAYSHLYDQPGFLGSKQTLYKTIQHGVLSSFHRKEGVWDTGFSFGFEWDKTALPDHSPETQHYVDSVGRALRFDPTMLGQGVYYLFVEPTVMRSTLDNALQPTKGSFTVVTAKGMAPVGGMRLAESFVRLTAEQSFFVPLYKMVVAVRFRLGHIFNKEFERIMPIERFFLGGANSVRGYDTDFVPPLGRYCDGKCKPQIVPQGGRSMVNANLELRFPIVGSLGGVLFQDVGALHDSSLAYIRASNCVAASGFGLRYQTPVGPLRFDVGRRWGRRSEDLRRIVWFFGFGSAF